MKQTGTKNLKDAEGRFSALVEKYSMLSAYSVERALSRAAAGYMNTNPFVQNRRIKSISSLPCDFTKDEVGLFLRTPYTSEKQLRQTAEGLKWTTYPFYKIGKTYQDISTYHNYFMARTKGEESKTEEFMREANLVDLLNKTIQIESFSHKVTGQAAFQGKVFYYPRYAVDKVHNKVRHAFLQQLPTDYCYIVGNNNVSGYTIAFNLMYFMQAGTSVYDYGDLFLPYLDDFNLMFEEEGVSTKEKVIYASRINTISCENNGKKLIFCPQNLKDNSLGSPWIEAKDGAWAYYVVLPVGKIWTFEIDDTTAATASPLSGLMLTYAQLADYESAQLQLLLNPLIKIFTGEMRSEPNAGIGEDKYTPSIPGRELFLAFWYQTMADNNTGGTAFYAAPFANIKSHDYAESANANNISKSFITYSGAKSGLNAIIPMTDDIKASQVDASEKIESRYTTSTIYPQVMRMMNYIYDTLNLRYEWKFFMFGTIFTDDNIRDQARKDLDKGDISAFFILSAMDGQSWLDKLSMIKTIGASGIMDLLQVPKTAYTQSEKSSSKDQNGGRPKSEDMSDSKEHSIDAGGETE